MVYWSVLLRLVLPRLVQFASGYLPYIVELFQIYYGIELLHFSLICFPSSTGNVQAGWAAVWGWASAPPVTTSPGIFGLCGRKAQHTGIHIVMNELKKIDNIGICVSHPMLWLTSWASHIELFNVKENVSTLLFVCWIYVPTSWFLTYRSSDHRKVWVP